MKRLVAICIAALAVLATTAAAHRAPTTALSSGSALVIRADSAGLHSLGGFHPLRNPTVGAAVRAFGRPSSRQARYGGDACDISWEKIGLEMSFAYYGLGGRWAACQGSRGIAKFARIEGPRADRWQTSRGLRIGDSREQLERHHPGAVEWEGDYWLAIGYTEVGEATSYPILTATLQAEVVRGFEAIMSPSYD